MTIQAQLADGTTLEFPDGTEDSVVDRVVKSHLSSAQPKEKDTSHNWKGAEEESIGKRALGGAAAASDFITGMASLPLAGIAGVVGGIQDKVTGKDDFLPGAVRRIEEVQKATSLGELTGLAQGEGYQTAQGVLGLPAEAGIKASRGIGALTRLPFQGLQGAVEHLEHPERSPLSSTIEDTTGTFLGYGVVGPMAKRGGQAIAKIDPTLRNIKAKKPVDLTPEQQKVMQARNEEVYRQQYQDRGEVYPGDKQKEMGIPERVPMEPLQSSPLFPDIPDVDATQARNPFARPEERQKDFFEDDPLAKQQAEENAAAIDYEARQQEFGPDKPETNPQDLALDYDPFGLKDLEKIPEATKLADEGIDYSTLPETVNKDYVLQNQLKRYEELKARLGEVAAKELTLKQDEGPSYYPNTEINEKFQREFKKEQDKLQKNLENLKKEIDTRLRNEHGWSYPSLEGPKQPYSRSIYTRQR